MSKEQGYIFVVAHYDHGIRPDSAEDRKLVQQTAEKYGLTFVFEEGKLGPNASEATAREARYGFLRRVQKEHGADAIITAHHQDDLIETAIINTLRGTGRKGLTALKSSKDIVRPLLDYSKQELVAYAKANKLMWREDTTNLDTRYLRNYIRLVLLPKMPAGQREQLLAHIDSLREVNQAIDEELARHLQPQGGEIDRHWFIMLPHAVSREAMAAWLRQHDIRDFDRKQLERLVHAAKTLAVSKLVDIDSKHRLEIKKNRLALIDRDR